MKLQIIYTLENSQELANFHVKAGMLKTKKSLILFAKNALQLKMAFVPIGWKEKIWEEIQASGKNEYHLPDDISDMPVIKKLSLSLIGEGDETNPDIKWFDECNGKIWENELK